MIERDTKECRNCHKYETMDPDKQKDRSVVKHEGAIEDGKTCIECHKGIAHHLPDMAGVPMVTQNWHEQMIKDTLMEPWQIYISEEIGGTVTAAN